MPPRVSASSRPRRAAWLRPNAASPATRKGIARRKISGCAMSSLRLRIPAFFRRYGTLEEQVGPILFLASDEASYVTGSVLPVAGGDLE
nr:SDR family oxidoreductase [Sphingobium lactosutens]